MAHFFQDESTAARLSCSNCSQLYYLHNLQVPPTDSVVPSSSASLSSAAPPSSALLSESSAPAPSWMTMGTFSNASTGHVAQERMRHAQPPASSSTSSSFRQWGPDIFSADSTATVNDRRISAAQRHQPAPHGLPVPARGVAQSPLHLLPTITLPRVTRTAAHSAVRNPRSQFASGAQASSTRIFAPKTLDYKFACVILPTGVSQFIFLQKRNVILTILQINGFTSKSGIFIEPRNIRAPTESKSRLFFTKAEHLHLSFIFRMQASQGDLIINDLNECLRKHMDFHKLSLVLENPQSHLFSPSSTPSLSPELPWQILFAKQTQRNTRYSPLLSPFPIADTKRLSFKKLWDLMVNRQGERRIPAVAIDDEPHQLLLIGK